MTIKDSCSFCHKTEPEVPLCLFTIIMMDGEENDEICCPNCAHRVSGSADVYRVELQGSLGMNGELAIGYIGDKQS